VLIGLFVAFAVICIVVSIQKGKNAKWIARKMKFGGAILTITAITTGCPPMVTCYDPMPTNMFEFDSIDYTEAAIVADLPTDSIITGKVYTPESEKYNFDITTQEQKVVYNGEVIATDGSFDEETEEFRITIDTKLDTGKYNLNIYNGSVDDSTKHFVAGANLKIE
jgi:hypothetical protein